MDELNAENIRKQYALDLLSQGLEVGNRYYELKLAEDGKTVDVIDKRSGATKQVNVNGDSITAMYYDVMKRCRDWFL